MHTEDIVIVQLNMKRIKPCQCVQQRVTIMKNHFSQKQLLFQQQVSLLRRGTAVFFQQTAGFVQCFRQRILRCGFEHEGRHLILNGLLSIFKIRKACQQNDLRPRAVLTHPGAQLQAVHFRHADVRDQYVRRLFPDLTDCIYTISGYCRYLAITAAPINKLHQSLGDDRLIIHQHNRIHHHISLSIGNASMICVPDPGWDRMVREA